MKLSTKGRYGVMAMYDLAINYNRGSVVPLNTIAHRQGISEHYLEQLMGTLRRSGFVNSMRGAGGGYVLAKPPNEITIGDIIRIMEGPIAPVDCLLDKKDKYNKYCSKAECCVTRNVWDKVRNSIDQVLDNITLEDLCNENNDI